MQKKELITFLKKTQCLEQVLNILPYLKDLDLSDREYAMLIEHLSRKFTSIATLYQKNYPLLYQLLEKMKEKNAPLQTYFKAFIVYPIIKHNFYPYLESMLDQLKITSSQISYHGFGSSNFTFFTDNNMVLKIGDKRTTFDFPTFYRINDLIIQKKFTLDEKILYLEVSPKGQKIALNKEDKKAIDQDFQRAGILLTDPNYENNFAIFENDYHISYQDIDGKHETISIPPSKEFQKKKIKLIDLDYIYRKNQRNVIWAPKL